MTNEIEFIATETDSLLHSSDTLDDKLLGETPSMTRLYQQIRKDMRDYVGRVRGCLEG